MRNGEFCVTLYSKTIYKEIQLKQDMELLRAGTTPDCDIRFNKDRFFTGFELTFIRKADSWSVICGDSIYLRKEGILKQRVHELTPGEKFHICYSEYNSDIFTVEFLYDFNQIVDYNTCFDFPQQGVLRIGGEKGNDIVITDEMVETNYIVISRQGSNYMVDSTNSIYGIYVNGSRFLGIRQVADCDFIMLAGYSFFIRDGIVYTHAWPNMLFRTVTNRGLEQEHGYHYPKFNRTTRIHLKAPEESIEILDPPLPEEIQPQSLLLLTIPAIVSLVLTVVLRGFMGSGGTFILYSAATMSMGMILSVINYIQDKKRHEKKEQQRVADYQQYIGKKESQICEIRQKELSIMNRIHTSLSENVDSVFHFMPNIFEKDIYSEDFMLVRLGTGTISSSNQVSYKPMEMASRDSLAYYPQQLSQKYQYLENAPVICNLRQQGSVGIVGNWKELEEFVRTILLDLVIRHYFQEVKVVYFGDEKESSNIIWLHWLKHNTEEDSGRRLNAFNEESKNKMLDFLYSEFVRRDSLSEDKKKDLIYFVVVVQDIELIGNHPILGFLHNSEKNRFSFLFLTDNRELLPFGLSGLINLHGNCQGCFVDCTNGDNMQMFTYATVTQETALQVSYKLAGIELDEISLESTLTKHISLFKLLQIKNVNDLNLDKRWKASMSVNSLAAPIGVRAGGELVYLDIHEKFHGPHGLVAGTTGSGKSEILQTYILSMATLFHPYEVSFVIIDFKGDGMVGQLRGLPHLAGAITNIDGKEINRSLRSIHSEIHKREQCLAKAKVNHIDKYIKKYHAGECEMPLPHLILIVDEFAELKSDQPEFMKELISTARIGRSLGIHLILATQKPAGVVNDQIWSNSRFKLCLKVQNKEDSNEVLKSPLAAEIREPGRAYLQVGNHEIFELFQSAYSGASARDEEADNRKEFSIAQVDLAGNRAVVYQQKPDKNGEESETQLNAVVEYIAKYSRAQKVEALPAICLPPLASKIHFENRISERNMSEYLFVPFGVYDDPDHQYQGEVIVDLSSNHLLIIGSPQYGKTNMLQLAIRYAATNYSPEEAVFYILDCSSRILKNYEKLAHVGGVVLASEEDRMKYFMKMIFREMEERKDLLAELGLSSFAAYREAGYREKPLIIVMLDNYTAFRELFEEYENSILSLLHDGITTGITLCVTNGQTSGINFRIRSAFTKKIALYCNDNGEYTTLLERCRMEPDNIVGRGLVEIDKRIFEFQSYLCFEGEKEINRIDSMKKFIDSVNSRYPGLKARQLPVMPATVTVKFLQDTFSMDTNGTYIVPLGMDYGTMEPVTIDLSTCNLLGISGAGDFKSTDILFFMLKHLYQIMFDKESRIYLLDGPKRHLKELSDWGIVQEYSIDGNALSGWVEELYQVLSLRYERFLQEGADCLEQEPLLCVVVENREAAQILSRDSGTVRKYQEMLAKYKEMKWIIIYSDLENTSIGYNTPAALKSLNENKHLLFFGDLEKQKLFETKIRPGSFRKGISSGDAYYWEGNDILKIKTVKLGEV